MNEHDKHSELKPILFGICIGLALSVIFTYVSSSRQLNSEITSALQSNYSTLKADYGSLQSRYTALMLNQSTTVKVTRQVLYDNYTVRLAPPSYNYDGYNRITDCYLTYGYYNFSFYVPYSGYVVFNETNTGIPTNQTSSYFSAIFTSNKPWYENVSTYNDSGYCTGEVLSSASATTKLSPYNNQTFIIPVKNGTNYVVFYNLNQNPERGIGPLSINVTYSMTYYGFKGTEVPGFLNQTITYAPPSR